MIVKNPINPNTNKIQQNISKEAWGRIQEQQAKDTMEKQKYGEVRPIIHTNFQGNKVVAVGNRLYLSKSWKTFPDFLSGYIQEVLGTDWGNSEIAKPFEERHIILKWYDGFCHFQNQHERDENGLFAAVPNGITAAYLTLAYDLYILRHHSALQERIIQRLKHKDQFQGARYELFVIATCIRAGFDIKYEDESDRKRKHTEFIATHRNTGQTITVEAKSRHRAGILGFGKAKESEVVKAGIGSLLNQALLKPVNWPYVIFIDLNLPPYKGKIIQQTWFKEIVKTIDQIGNGSKTEPDPFNLIVFTNHPNHYVKENELYPNYDTSSIFPENTKIFIKHSETLLKIHEAALQFGNIPNEFPEN
ncbi:MAG: hypothetical protein A2X59_03265 [Nitrospirae bacterium GWC2_42_7]|nr:MAG: hypothetical protein A2X59_03265 [Nitrospirae bacterium GWC2_42_7]